MFACTYHAVDRKMVSHQHKGLQCEGYPEICRQEKQKNGVKLPPLAGSMHVDFYINHHWKKQKFYTHRTVNGSVAAYISLLPNLDSNSVLFKIQCRMVSYLITDNFLIHFYKSFN